MLVAAIPVSQPITGLFVTSWTNQSTVLTLLLKPLADPSSWSGGSELFKSNFSNLPLWILCFLLRGSDIIIHEHSEGLYAHSNYCAQLKIIIIQFLL